MGLIRATIETLASVLGCRQDQAEGVVHSTASARAAMSRRGFFKAAGAVAAGVVMLDAAPAEAAYQGRLTSYSQFLKEHYTTDKLRSLMYPEPSLKLVRRPEKGVYEVTFPLPESVSADDYIFMRGDRLEVFRTHPGETDYRFQDDTRELLATVTDIDKRRGIITYDSAPVRRK